MDKQGTPQKSPKSVQTRKRIVSSYAELLADHDYDKISVSALCKKAGIVRSTFYVYFSDIYDVIQYLEDDLIVSFKKVDAAALAATDEREKLVTDWGFSITPPLGFEEWFDACEANRAGLRAMLGPHGDPYFEQKLRKELESHVSLLMEKDRMPDDGLRRGFVESFVEVHVLLVRNWMTHENTSLSKERICTILQTMRVGGNAIGRYSNCKDRDFKRCEDGLNAGLEEAAGAAEGA